MSVCVCVCFFWRSNGDFTGTTMGNSIGQASKKEIIENKDVINRESYITSTTDTSPIQLGEAMVLHGFYHTAIKKGHSSNFGEVFTLAEL